MPPSDVLGPMFIISHEHESIFVSDPNHQVIQHRHTDQTNKESYTPLCAWPFLEDQYLFISSANVNIKELKLVLTFFKIFLYIFKLFIFVLNFVLFFLDLLLMLDRYLLPWLLNIIIRMIYFLNGIQRYIIRIVDVEINVFLFQTRSRVIVTTAWIAVDFKLFE